MRKALRIIFMGTPDFAVPSLRALLAGPDTILAAVCQPDREQGRGKKIESPPVKHLAAEHALLTLQPTSLRDPQFLTRLIDLKPDLFVVVAYGKILPSAILQLAPLGAINVHGSLLPKYRGAAPIQWALINGEKETGITIMQLDEGMDTGPTLHKVHEPIQKDDTAVAIFRRLAHIGGHALIEALAKLKEGELVPQAQNPTLASYAPMLTKAQGHINWSEEVEALQCLIRGLDPWPSAYGFVEGVRYRFFSPEVSGYRCSQKPGTICRIDQNGLLIAAADGMLIIREIQVEGKKRMSVADCFHGLALRSGMVLS